MRLHPNRTVTSLDLSSDNQEYFVSVRQQFVWNAAETGESKRASLRGGRVE